MTYLCIAVIDHEICCSAHCELRDALETALDLFCKEPETDNMSESEMIDMLHIHADCPIEIRRLEYSERDARHYAVPVC